MTLKDKISQKIHDAVNNYDFEDIIDNALDRIDIESLISDAISRKLDRIDAYPMLEDLVKECIDTELDDIDFEDEIFRAMEDIL